MAIAYKWKITDNFVAYITDEKGGSPFIYDNRTKAKRIYYESPSQTEEMDVNGIPNDTAVEVSTNKMSADNYVTALGQLKEMVAEFDFELDDSSQTLNEKKTYYWPKDEYNRTVLDTEPNLKIIDASGVPSFNATIVGTDSTKKVKLDLNLPKGYDGYYTYMTPPNLSFIREDILTEGATGGLLSGSTEIFLYRGVHKLDIYSITLKSQTNPEDTITVELNEDGNGSVTVIPQIRENATRQATKGVRGIVTTTTTPTPTTTVPPQKSDLDDRKVIITVTYRYRERKSTEWIYYDIDTVLRYNILTLDITKQFVDGNSASLILNERHRFMLDMQSLADDIIEQFEITAAGMTSLVTNFNNTIGSRCEIAAGKAGKEVWDSANGLYASFIDDVNSKTISLTNEVAGTKQTLTRTADSTTETLINEFEQTQTQIKRTAQGSKKKMTDWAEAAEAEIMVTSSSYERKYKKLSGECATYFAVTKQGLKNQAFWDDYVAEFHVYGDEVLSVVSSVTDSYSKISVTADKIDRVVGDLSGMSIMETSLSGISLGVRQNLNYINGELEKWNGITVEDDVIKVTGDQVNFEGETTINSGFSIDMNGTATIKNGTIQGTYQVEYEDVTHKRLYVSNSVHIYDIIYDGPSGNSLNYLAVPERMKLIDDKKGDTGGYTKLLMDKENKFSYPYRVLTYTPSTFEKGDIDKSNSGYYFDYSSRTYYTTQQYSTLTNQEVKDRCISIEDKLFDGYTWVTNYDHNYTVFPIRQKDSLNYIFDAKQRGVGHDTEWVNIYLPIDSEYIGSKISIVINNEGADSPINIKLIPGRTANYGTYVTDETDSTQYVNYYYAYNIEPKYLTAYYYPLKPFEKEPQARYIYTPQIERGQADYILLSGFSGTIELKGVNVTTANKTEISDLISQNFGAMSFSATTESYVYLKKKNGDLFITNSGTSYETTPAPISTWLLSNLIRTDGQIILHLADGTVKTIPNNEPETV